MYRYLNDTYMNLLNPVKIAGSLLIITQQFLSDTNNYLITQSSRSSLNIHISGGTKPNL